MTLPGKQNLNQRKRCQNRHRRQPYDHAAPDHAQIIQTLAQKIPRVLGDLAPILIKTRPSHAGFASDGFYGFITSFVHNIFAN